MWRQERLLPFHLFRNIPGEKGGERMALDTNAVIPAHVALILDGNGRWAKKEGFPEPWDIRRAALQ